MKNYTLVKNKEEIFARTSYVQIKYKFRGQDAWTWLENLFKACKYDEQTGILGVNYIAYGIAKTRQWLNCPAVPYIEALTDKENFEIQQELQKRLCISEMKRLIKTKQEIRFHNTEYGIEGAGKNIREAFETFINNAVKKYSANSTLAEYFLKLIKDDIDLRGDHEEYREIYFYNMENCEIYLPKKYVNKIWDEIENRLGEDVKIDEATKAEKLWEMNERR